MKTSLVLISILVCININAQTKDPGAKNKAIICLTYDDKLQSQLDIVIPQLDSFGFKATFFLNSVNGSPDSIIGKGSYDLLGWKKAAAEGYELANHTLFHPCPEKLGWQKEIAIESYTIPQLMNEIKACDAMLTMIDGKASHPSFAYPCNNNLIHDTDYIEILKQYGFIKYARGPGDSGSIVTDFSKLDYMRVPGYFVQRGTTADELIAFAEKVKQKGGLGIFLFHGIDTEPFRISADAHRALMNYLKQNSKEIWVATFSEAMDYVASKK
ncbi:MAG TPA: polysaccharide deacetylase family protein [Parafilimonas sp.]|nr:polysaccharide deacetylase family protein [Parafilimonas sp.]